MPNLLLADWHHICGWSAIVDAWKVRRLVPSVAISAGRFKGGEIRKRKREKLTGSQFAARSRYEQLRLCLSSNSQELGEGRGDRE